MVDIQLMRPDPAVICEGRPALKIVGRPSLLLRLLGLHEGETVSADAIASLHGKEDTDVPGKARALRVALGDFRELVKTDNQVGYHLDIANCSVDAIRFRDTVEPIVNASMNSLDPDTALGQISVLEQALKHWQGNPGFGLPARDFYYESEFDSLKKKVHERLILARLHSGEHDQIKRAIDRLQLDVETQEANIETWRLLLLAYDAIGSKHHVSKTWGDINDFFGASAIPQSLDTTMARVSRSEPNPFRVGVTASPSTTKQFADGRTNSAIEARSEDQTNILAVCEAVGITTASRLKLVDSQLTPEACIAQTRRRLWFSGVLASKWVTEPAVRAQLDELLKRLDADNGEVRFMMINPDGEGYARLRELRRDNISLESVDWLRELAAKHSSFEVRMFDSLPSFRVMIIDDDVVSFSPYRLAADAYMKSVRGWDAPHVVLDPLAPYPLAEAFQQLFSETWNSATPLGD